VIDAAIGRTPLVRLEKVVEPGMAEVWMKVEGMNPGGSIKDRTALGMITDAEQRGVLRPGGTIVEPTSGNTGIGLAQVAAARGYRLVLCLPSQMSEERKRTLIAYGAKLVLTDPERRMLAAIEEAERIRDRTGAWMPNQFSNPANPAIHYRLTGPELWEQMEGRIDAFVYGSGTGGTISGVGRYIKERSPKTAVISVEHASIPGHGAGLHPGQLRLVGGRSRRDRVGRGRVPARAPARQRGGVVRRHVHRRHRVGGAENRARARAREARRVHLARFGRALPDHGALRDGLSARLRAVVPTPASR
jgi:cysteine synthase